MLHINQTYAKTTGDGCTPIACTVKRANMNEKKPFTVTADAIIIHIRKEET